MTKRHLFNLRRDFILNEHFPTENTAVQISNKAVGAELITLCQIETPDDISQAIF